MPTNYSCDICASDFTARSGSGPATIDSLSVTRCYFCQNIWERKRASLSPFSDEEATVIRLALLATSRTRYDAPVEISERQRTLALEIWARSL